MSRDDGGPAFSRPRSADPDHFHEPDVYPAQDGLSVRDYFAAKALDAILAQPDGGIQSYSPDSHIAADSEMRAAQLWAENAYQIADAMLAERTKP